MEYFIKRNKKSIITSFIKFIDVSIDENYNVKIENITFNNEFLQNSFYDIPAYLLNKFKNNNHNIKYLGMCTKEQLNRNVLKNMNYYSFNELVKNYSKDRKTLETILTKFKDKDLGIMMLIEDKKFVDAIITNEKTE